MQIRNGGRRFSTRTLLFVFDERRCRFLTAYRGVVAEHETIWSPSPKNRARPSLLRQRGRIGTIHVGATADRQRAPIGKEFLRDIRKHLAALAKQQPYARCYIFAPAKIWAASRRSLLTTLRPIPVQTFYLELTHEPPQRILAHLARELENAEEMTREP